MGTEREKGEGRREKRDGNWREERKIRRKRKRWKKRSLDTSGEMEEKSN